MLDGKEMVIEEIKKHQECIQYRERGSGRERGEMLGWGGSQSMADIRSCFVEAAARS